MSAIGRLLRGENQIDFIRWWRRGLVLSTVLIVVTLGSLALQGLNLTVEFTGGVATEMPVSGVTVEQARAALDEAGLAGARVQIVTDVSGSETLRVQTIAESGQVQDELRTVVATLAQVEPSQVSITAVSASWGADVTAQAIRALAFFLLAILVYLTLRLEFRMAVGAVIAVVHDVIITVGIYSLFRFEVSPSTLISFLMILGYSIYDTVVIFDKVKAVEPQVGMSNRLTYARAVDRAMNTVLLRSLNTSVAALLPVISLIVVGAGLMGAVVLNQFAVALAVGLLVGTYSSIMIAAPAVVLLKEREPRYRQLQQRLGGPTILGRGGDAEVPAPTSDESAQGAPGCGRTATAVGAPRPTPSGVIPPRPRKKSGNRNRRR